MPGPYPVQMPQARQMPAGVPTFGAYGEPSSARPSQTMPVMSYRAMPGNPSLVAEVVQRPGSGCHSTPVPQVVPAVTINLQGQAAGATLPAPLRSHLVSRQSSTASQVPGFQAWAGQQVVRQ
ncbi:unnamed protein product, partial [Polarella glacialis]